MMNRRKFLAVGSGTLVSLGSPISTLAVISSDTENSTDIDQKLKAECKVYSAGQFVTRLNLVGLERPFIHELRVAQYILNFEAVEPVNLAEASYELSHPELGHLELFLQPCGTPVRGQHNGIHYRACMAMLR